MRIILLERIESLGGIGDIVDVRAGYGRNYLLPQGKAAPANDEQIAAFEERRAELMAAEKERMAATAERVEQVRSAVPLVIVANAGPVGKLYGSVGPAEISAGFSSAGVEVARAEVQMPEGPIKELGEHRVALKLHAGVTEEIDVHVVGRAEEVEEETEALPGGEPLLPDEDDEDEDLNLAEFAPDAAAAPEAQSEPGAEAESESETAPKVEAEPESESTHDVEAAPEPESEPGDTAAAEPAAAPEEAANRDGDG